MVGVNLFADHLIKGNFSKLAQVVIQFKEFSKISEKLELHDVGWKYLPQNILKKVLIL